MCVPVCQNSITAFIKDHCPFFKLVLSRKCHEILNLQTVSYPKSQHHEKHAVKANAKKKYTHLYKAFYYFVCVNQIWRSNQNLYTKFGVWATSLSCKLAQLPRFVSSASDITYILISGTTFDRWANSLGPTELLGVSFGQSCLPMLLLMGSGSKLVDVTCPERKLT